MTRFFIPGIDPSHSSFVLRDDDAEHIKVLRMRAGERLIVCDGEGRDCICRIEQIEESSVYVANLGTVANSSEPSLRCLILAAMPKGDRADYLVQKCSEMGAAEIVFFLSERCVSRPTDKDVPKKLLRLQRIAAEAAKQSGRGTIPEVGFVRNLDSAIEKAKETELPILMYETGERTSLRNALLSGGEFLSAAVITGPEGGFEDWEAERCRQSGLKVCAMGPRILRCETAPLAALTAIMYHTGNLD